MKHRGAWGLLLCALAGCGDRVGDTTPEARGSLLGRVLLAPDVPAAAARVVVTGTGQGAIANAAGEFERGGLRPGRYQLMASAAESGDYVPRRFQAGVTAGGIANLETIVLGKPGAIGGRILNAELADLTLAIVGIDGTGIVTAPSDRRAYVLQAVPPGVHDVTLVTPMGVIVKRGVRVTPGRTTTGVDLDLAQVKAASGSLEGVAVRVEDGPSASGGIGVELRSALTGVLVGTAVKTSADGSFSLPVPRQGAYAVRATSGERHVTVGGVLFAGGQQRLLTRLVIPLLDDLDGDGKGAADDDDDDGDGVPDAMDAFDDDFAESVDADGDGLGDEADLATMGSEAIDVKSDTPDSDGDGRFDFEDNCVMRPNPTQEDVDQDAVGDACDNCPRSSNPEQQDGDMDDVGDACPSSTVTCGSRGAQCGPIADGAGGTVDCGMCPSGQSCGAGGQANRCKATCVAAASCAVGFCGSIDDGCGTGGRLNCGSCTWPNVCTANRCVLCNGFNACAADECGTRDDGCMQAHDLQCNPVCPGAQTCGGGGIPNHCGLGMFVVRVVSGEDQLGFPGQQLAPVVVQVTRAGTLIAGAAVTVTAQSLGASHLGGVLTTNSEGQASFTPILGRMSGPQLWQIGALLAPDSGSTSVQASANAPVGAAAGTVVPIVNASKLPGSTPDLSGPASQARASGPVDVEVASDGTIYFSDSNFASVFAVSPVGAVRRVAGTGQAGFSGDFGPATAARLDSPQGLALDQARNLLYIADYNNLRVRVVDLTTGIIETYAGGATGLPPPYGEGGPATSAALGAVIHLSLDRDGNLLLADPTTNTVRKVNSGTRIIDRYPNLAPAAANCVGVTPPAFAAGFAIARDASNQLFVYGSFCVADASYQGIGYARRIARIEADGKVVFIAGGDASPSDGALALGSSVDTPINDMAFDSAGQLFFSNAQHQIWRIDLVGRLHLVSGGGAGSGGDFGPASAATWSSPRGLTLAGDDLYVVDSGNASLRMIGAAGVASQAFSLTMGTGTMQTAPIGAALPNPLVVEVRAGTTPLASIPVAVQAMQAGAAVKTPSTVSDSNGVARALVRTSLTPGAHSYQVSLLDIHGVSVGGSPVTFMAMASAPTPGTTFYAINSERVQDNLGSAGPGTLLRMSTPSAIAVASDGTVYVASSATQVVLAMDSTGLVRVLAGLPMMAGFGGDDGPALAARLNSPTALALDETNPANRVLYVADQQNHRVRAIELDGRRWIYTVAGGGSAGPPDYGDGVPGPLAALSAPSALAWDPAPARKELWIWDQRLVLRRLDRNGIIHNLAVVGPLAPSCSYGYLDPCHLAVAADKLLMTGGISGVGMGVVEIDRLTGVPSIFAGAAAGTPSDGTARTAVFAQTGGIGADAAGNVVLVDPSAGKLYRITAAPALTITTLLGDGTQGFAGDYVPSTMGRLGGIARPALGPADHIWFTDRDNHALRVIW